MRAPVGANTIALTHEAVGDAQKMLPPLQASRKRLRLATSAGDICFDCGALVVLAMVEVGVGVGGGSGDGAIE